MTDILGIGSSGLTAYRKLLETTGNNIANANTEGYVRRDVVLKSTGEAQMLPTARLASSGSGVTVDLIRRASDAFLQMQVRAANARQAQSQIVSDGLVRIEKAVIAPTNTIGTAVQDFYAKAQDLSVTPSSTTSRLAFIDSAQRVAESFRGAATSVINEVTSADTSLKSSVDAVNSLAAQIARLNLDVSRTGKGQQKLNDLLDQRDVLLNNLSKLVNFTVVEKDSGAVDVYLGDAASGPKLVEYNTSRMLGTMKDGEKTELIFDPYGNANVTNQVSGGAIAGLLEFQKVARGILDNLNQLAVGFTNAINTQHRQGLDLNGRQGVDIFSAEGLEAVPYAANRGAAKISIAVDAATQVNNSLYTATFNAPKGTWTVSSKFSGASVTGRMPMTLEGIRFNAEGKAEDGDTFSVEPLKNASLAMRFLISDPASIAAAQKIYVDPIYTNIGTGSLTVARTDLNVEVPPLASMIDLFKSNDTDTLSFRKDGVTFTIPAGAKDVVLSSLGAPSSLSFKVSASELAAIQNDKGKIALSFKIDGATKSITVKPKGGSLPEIANDINQAAQANALGADVTASVTDGHLVITSLGGRRVSEGLITGIDGAKNKIKYASVDQYGTNPADMVVFTREGVQIAGEPIAPEDYPKWINLANGFLPTAQYAYRPDLAGTYRDMAMATTELPLTSVNRTSKILSFDIAADPNLESARTNTDGGVTAGAVYALDVRGLPSLRLGGDETAGMGAGAIANLMKTKLDALATSRFWLGNSFDLKSSTKPDFAFNLKIDDQDYAVNFTRSKDEKGNLLSTGIFKVDGPQPITLSLIDSGGEQRISLALPPDMNTEPSSISVEDNADSRLLGLVDAQNTKLMAGLVGAGQISETALLGGQTLSFTVDPDGPATAFIQSTRDVNGNLIDSGTADLKSGAKSIGQLRWSIVDGRIQFQSDVIGLQIKASTKSQRDAAQSLGFLGSDLTVEKTEGLFASAAFAANALKGGGTVIKVNIDGEDRELNVINMSGTTNVDRAGKTIPEVSWSVVDGKLVLKSKVLPFSIAARTDDELAAATALGFPSGDPSYLGTKTRMRITSSVSDDTNDVGGIISRSTVGKRLTIGATQEDLIVGVHATSLRDAARTISVRYPPDTARMQPVVPDFGVIVDSMSKLRIVRFDPKDRSNILETYAVRDWEPREPIQWLGMQFVMDGAIAVGDRFTITNGGQRSGDNRNALALAKLEAFDIFGKGQGSFQDVYASVSTKLGTSSQSATNDAKTAQQAAVNLQAAFDGKTGVDLDREASDLIRYQQAYQAAAQVVKSAKDMFDTILHVF